jgi:hypothetical protein
MSGAAHRLVTALSLAGMACSSAPASNAPLPTDGGPDAIRTPDAACGTDVTSEPDGGVLTPGEGQWCPAMTSRTPSASFQDIAAILGAPVLRSNVVIFDRANHRVGFAPHTACP